MKDIPTLEAQYDGYSQVLYEGSILIRARRKSASIRVM